MAKDTVKVIDNPQAPEVFVSNCVGFICVHGNVHMTFAAVKADHSLSGEAPADCVNLRVVMPIARAHAFAAHLFEYAKEQGAVLPTAIQ